MSTIAKLIIEVFCKLPDFLALSLFNFYLHINNIESKILKTGNLWLCRDSDGIEIHFRFKNRFFLYRKGARERVVFLAGQYGIDKYSFSSEHAFIDCGMNIGELAVFMSIYHPSVMYYGFEPNPEDYKVALKNTHGKGYLFNLGLWNASYSMDFYVADKYADSSFIKPPSYSRIINVKVERLDRILDLINKVYVFKVEAEGAEPEVLAGAERVLNKVDAIFVDAGFERGVKEESSLPQVVNQLLLNGYTFESLTKGRLISKFVKVVN